MCENCDKPMCTTCAEQVSEEPLQAFHKVKCLAAYQAEIDESEEPPVENVASPPEDSEKKATDEIEKPPEPPASADSGSGSQLKIEPSLEVEGTVGAQSDTQPVD